MFLIPIGEKLEISQGQTLLVGSPGHIGVLVIPLEKMLKQTLD